MKHKPNPLGLGALTECYTSLHFQFSITPSKPFYQVLYLYPRFRAGMLYEGITRLGRRV